MREGELIEVDKISDFTSGYNMGMSSSLSKNKRLKSLNEILSNTHHEKDTEFRMIIFKAIEEALS